MEDNTPDNILSELTRLENMRQGAANSAQRQFKRYAIRGDALLISAEVADTHHDGIEIHLRDVSRGGVGFLCDRELEANTCWNIIFYHQGLQIAQQPIVVRHSQAINNGLYLIGSMFCAEAGLLALLGVNASDLHASEDVGQDNDGEDGGNFLAPGDVAA